MDIVASSLFLLEVVLIALISDHIYARLFCTIDQNNDGYLSATELRALIIGVRFDQIELNKDDAVENLMKEFDTSRDARIDANEFFIGVSKWLNVAKRVANPNRSPSDRSSMKFLTDFHSVRFAY